MFALNKYLIAAAGVLALSMAGWGYGQYKYAQGRKTEKQEQYLSELEGFRETAEKLTALSGKFEVYATELRTAKPKIIERITRVEKENPLPVGCIIPVDGMRSINQAIDAANAASKPIGTMPSNKSAQQQ